MSTADPWTLILNETAAVSQMPGWIRRNTQISACYAEAYLSDTRLGWAGVAAFASKQVGCNLRLACFGPFRTTIRQPLAEGNVAVFKELYPSLRYCIDQGSVALLASLPTTFPQYLRSAFEQLAAGDDRGAAYLMLMHEQRYTLQTACFSHKPLHSFLTRTDRFAQWLRKCRHIPFAKALLAFLTFRVAFSSSCRARPHFTIALPPGDGPISDVEVRWSIAEQVLDFFCTLLTNMEHAAYIRSHLNRIRSWRNGS